MRGIFIAKAGWDEITSGRFRRPKGRQINALIRSRSADDLAINDGSTWSRIVSSQSCRIIDYFSMHMLTLDGFSWPTVPVLLIMQRMPP